MPQLSYHQYIFYQKLFMVDQTMSLPFRNNSFVKERQSGEMTMYNGRTALSTWAWKWHEITGLKYSYLFRAERQRRVKRRWRWAMSIANLKGRTRSLEEGELGTNAVWPRARWKRGYAVDHDVTLLNRSICFLLRGKFKHFGKTAVIISKSDSISSIKTKSKVVFYV